MPRKNSLINIFCYGLPGMLSRPICGEYDHRLEEINRIWDSIEYTKYDVLKPYCGIVESLLALSLFYKYVLGNISGVNEFYTKLNRHMEKEIPISIGSYVLDKKESNKLLAIAITFGKIKNRFQIDDSFFDFRETVDFLRKCIDLYNTPEREEDNTI